MIDIDTVREVYPSAIITVENEYLTLWIDGEIITQGESEVADRVKQIIKENGLNW